MEQHKTIIDELREESNPDIKNRRKIAALSALGLADFSVISLFQLGYIKMMPDIPGEIFDTEKVNSSKEAVLMGLPDGVVSLGMYTATMLLATVSSVNKKQSSWIDLLLGGIVLGQAAGAANYLYNMAFVQKRYVFIA